MENEWVIFPYGRQPLIHILPDERKNFTHIYPHQPAIPTKHIYCRLRSNSYLLVFWTKEKFMRWLFSYCSTFSHSISFVHYCLSSTFTTMWDYSALNLSFYQQKTSSEAYLFRIQSKVFFNVGVSLGSKYTFETNKKCSKILTQIVDSFYSLDFSEFPENEKHWTASVGGHYQISDLLACRWFLTWMPWTEPEHSKQKTKIIFASPPLSSHVIRKY